MRYGIVADVHGNLEALNVVLEQLKGVDAIVCMGDIVGYGADPDECCNLIRQRSRTTVLGNHDAAVAGLIDVSWFNPSAKAAIIWTREHLSQENIIYLGALKPVKQFPEFVMTHGSLVEPLEFTYITSTWDARPSFFEMEGVDVCFIGHSHLAEYYMLEEGMISPLHMSMKDGGVIQLRPGIKYIINCGSVGQPRDGNPRASFGVYDTEAGTVEITRVDYDIKTAQKKIRDAGLPGMLADRLAVGR